MRISRFRRFRSAAALALVGLCLGARPAASTTAAPAFDLAPQERAAADLLRTIWFAEERLRLLGAIDQNGDGAGEYGFLAELAGAVNLAGTSAPLALVGPLPAALGAVAPYGVARAGDYLFAMYLPGPGGYAMLEAASGGSPGGLDPNLSAQHFCCYAWPAEPLANVRFPHTFVVNEAGVVSVTPATVTQYEGLAVFPPGDSAYSSVGDMTAPLAALGDFPTGQDGNSWYVLPD